VALESTLSDRLKELGLPLLGLVFAASACIIMGAGLTTTPTRIIAADVVAAALVQFCVPHLATHFLGSCRGVQAGVTPAAALAALAAAGIARSESMRTGMSPFGLMGRSRVASQAAHSAAA
jgi:TRAP-type uncharacterized transport system fused permease subunit